MSTPFWGKRNCRVALLTRKAIEGVRPSFQFQITLQEEISVADKCHRPVSTCDNSSFPPPRLIRAFRCRPAPKRYVARYSLPREGAQLRGSRPLEAEVLRRAYSRAELRSGAVILETGGGFPRRASSRAESHGGQADGAYRHRRRTRDDFRHRAGWNPPSPVRCRSRPEGNPAVSVSVQKTVSATSLGSRCQRISRSFSDALLFAGNILMAESAARAARASPSEFRPGLTTANGGGSPVPARHSPRRCSGSDMRRRSPQTAFALATSAARPIRDTGPRSSSGFPSAECRETSATS